MQFELDFYGHRVITYLRDGHIYLHRRSVADMLDVNDEDDLLDPIMPFINDAVISLPVLEKKLDELIQHTLGNTVREYQKERAAQLDILKEELVPVIVKQLTYQYKALPRIIIERSNMSGLGGVIEQKMPWGEDESYFTPETVGLLLQKAQAAIPDDIPFRFVVARDVVWDSIRGCNVERDCIQKLIALNYLGYVLRENAKPRSIFKNSPQNAQPFRSSTLDPVTHVLRQENPE